MRTIAHRLAAVGAIAVVVAGSALAAAPAHAEDVNVVPVAVDDAYTTAQSTTLQVEAPGLLANDIDPDSGIVLHYVDQGGTQGTVAFNALGGFIFTPTPGFSGTTSFLYRAHDDVTGLVTELATVTITVEPAAEPANTPPSAKSDWFYAEIGATEVLSPALMKLLGTDVDGDALTVEWQSLPMPGMTVLPDGSLEWPVSVDACGVVLVPFRLFDGEAFSNVATVELRVSDGEGYVDCPEGDVEPVVVDIDAVDDEFYAEPGQTISVGADWGPLANDLHSEGWSMLVTQSTPASKGWLTLLEDGSFQFIAPADFCESATFTYRATDGDTVSEPATVTIVASISGKTIECLPTSGGEGEGSSPTEPSEPATPTEPEQPAEPSEPTTPAEPTDSSEPAEPTQPELPTEPLADPQPQLAATPREQLALTGAPEQLLSGLGTGALLALLLGAGLVATGVRRRMHDAR